MVNPVKIGNRFIGNGLPPLIVAELSGNHQRSLALAEQMIDAAADAGAHAIKLQTYTADSITLDIEAPDFIISEEGSLWQGRKLHDLYCEAATPYEWHDYLFKKARERGLLAFSSPFDPEAVEFLERLDVPCYKIASFENTDLPLIEAAARTGKPLIISTGMASLEELQETVSTARTAGCRELVLLKCTSAYPAPVQDCNLATIAHMQHMFDCPTGLSDHTLGISVALASVAIGACMVEKHFVMDRSAGGVDADFSLEPGELRQLAQESAQIHAAIGEVNYGKTDSDQSARQYRRSIYAAKNIAAGEPLSPQNIRIVRPARGLAPKYYTQVMGRVAKQGIAMGTPIQWDLLDEEHS